MYCMTYQCLYAVYDITTKYDVFYKIKRYTCRCNTILSILYDERIEFVLEEEKHRCSTFTVHIYTKMYDKRKELTRMYMFFTGLNYSCFHMQIKLRMITFTVQFLSL